MKLRGTGFCFGTQVTAPECSFDAFFEWLSTQNKLQHSWPFGKDVSRTLATTVFFQAADPDVVMGLFISKRSSDTSHFVDYVDGDVVVKSKTDKNNPRREMNLVAISRKTWRGIYSSYEGSYACSLFVKDLWQVYLHFVRSRKTELDPDGNRSDDFSTRGHGTYDILTSIAKFEEHVKLLDSLSEVRYRIYTAKAPKGAPITENDIKSEFRCIALKAYKPGTSFFKWAKGFARSTRRPKAKGEGAPQFSVVGKNTEGTTVTIPFEDFAEDYVQMKYSDLGTAKLSELKSNAIMSKMLTQLSIRSEFTKTK